MRAELFADIVLYLHFLYVLAVLVPVPLIPIGVRLHWKWVRNKRLRQLHFAMIAFVALEAAIGVMCPLTILEDALRHGSAHALSGRSFVSIWVSRVMFYELPPWAFTAGYLLFTLLVAALYWRFPPQGAVHGQQEVSS